MYIDWDDKMVEETIEIQTVDEVHQIDERRQMSEIIDNQAEEHNNNLSNINDQLIAISDTIDNIQVGDVDLSEVTDKIDELDTTMITTQNQDILETLSAQQNQINSIEDKIDNILKVIKEM